MSTLFNLSTYSLAYLLTCTNWVLSCICERLAKHASRIIFAHLEMISILFICAFFLEIKVLMLVVTLLKLLQRLISYLALCYMFVIY
jgi:hypothetical protein